MKEGGTVFFRESCFKQSGDAKRGSNPTHYRNPRNYFAMFDSAEVGAQPVNRSAVCYSTCYPFRSSQFNTTVR